MKIIKNTALKCNICNTYITGKYSAYKTLENKHKKVFKCKRCQRNNMAYEELITYIYNGDTRKRYNEKGE